MHRTVFTLLAITALAIGGCSDDDEDSGTGGTGGSTGGTGGGTGGAGGGTGGTGGTGGGTGGTGGGTGGSAGGTAAAEVIDCAGQTIAKTIDIPNATAFSPATESVAVGEIVKWDNSDTFSHTVTSGTSPSTDGKFDTGGIAAGASKCVKFLMAGSYPYFCTIHPNMQATVSVQ